MKRKLSLMGLTLLLCLTLLPAQAFASEEKPAFHITLSDNSIEAGQGVELTVQGKHLKDLYGYEIRVAYDTKKLRFKQATTPWKGFTVPPIDKDGVVTFAHTKIGKTAGENGTVELGTFSFESIREGEGEDADGAVIELIRAKLVDSNGGSSTLDLSVRTTVEIASNPVVVAFSDIAHHWARESIIRAAALGWVNGYPDGSFRPDGRISRAEFTAMLARAVALPAGEGPAPEFADAALIPEWARPFILKAAGAGIIQGYEDGAFRSGQPITRSEITVMIMRASGESADKGNTPSFADAALIPAWASPSVAAAHELGFIQGRGNNLFVPGAHTTRAEAVTLILRLLDYMKV